MNLYYGFFFLLVFILGFLSFMFFRFHYLMLLLSVELMMLSLFLGISSFMFLGFGGIELLISFLLLMVCGAGFGICLMILFAREDGNEMFSYSYM